MVFSMNVFKNKKRWKNKKNVKKRKKNVFTSMLTTNHYLSGTCTKVTGVENIGQCGRLSQLSWLLGAL